MAGQLASREFTVGALLSTLLSEQSVLKLPSPVPLTSEVR